MRDIEVSVGIITYAQEKYIKKCLDSIFSQETNFAFQVIVAEDASPDNTRSILLEYKEKYEDQLVLILHNKNMGPNANLVSIDSYIKGKYIAIVEGDDYWTDVHKLQKQYDILEKHPEYSAVCCDFMTVDSDGEVLSKRKLRLKKDTIKTMQNWLNEPYSLHTCTIFRRNIFPVNDPKYIELSKCAPTMGDVIIFTLMYDYGPIYVLKDIMAAHRSAGPNDISSYSLQKKKDPLKYTRMLIFIFSNLEQYFDGKYDFTKRKCIKIAGMKIGRIRGTYEFSNREIGEIEKQFSLKWRIFIFFRVWQMLLLGIFRRIRRISED